MRRKQIAKLVQALHSWDDSLKNLGECRRAISANRRLSEYLYRLFYRKEQTRRRHRYSGNVLPRKGFRVQCAISTKTRHRLLAVRRHRANWTSTLGGGITEHLSALTVGCKRSQSELRPAREKVYPKEGFSVASEHHTPEELEDLNRAFEGIITDVIFLTGEHFPSMRFIYPRRKKRKT